MIRYKTKAGILSNWLDDELVLMSLEADAYVALDPVGSRIWELLAEPRSLEELIALLLAEYEVDEAKCRQDVAHYIADLVARGLIEELAA